MSQIHDKYQRTDYYVVPVLIAGFAVLSAIVQLIIFPPIQPSWVQFVFEGMFPLMAVVGLFLVQRMALDTEVKRPLVLSLFFVVMYGVTETVDELVLPPLWVSVVFEHLFLLVGTGFSLIALRRWAANRRDREQGLRRYQTAIETSPGPIYAIDMNHRFTLVNGAFVSLVGKPREQLLGEPLSLLLDEEIMNEQEFKQTQEAFESLRTGREQTVRLETTVSTREARRTFEHSLSYFTHESHNAFVSVGHDITSREERREQLKMLNRLLRHNLRNAFTVINGCADHIYKSVSGNEPVETNSDQQGQSQISYSESQSRTAELATKIIDRSAKLLAQTEKVKRLEKVYSSDNSPTNIQLNDFLNEIRRISQKRYPNSQFGVTAPSEQITVPDVALGEVIDELIENANEHVESPSIELRGIVESDRLKIEIIDDGPGLPETEREIVENRSQVPLNHSTGIGLWVARWIIEQSGGSISFGEADSDGTVAIITCPIDRTPKEPSAEDTKV